MSKPKKKWHSKDLPQAPDNAFEFITWLEQQLETIPGEFRDKAELSYIESDDYSPGFYELSWYETK